MEYLKKIGEYFMHDGISFPEGGYADLYTSCYEDKNGKLWYFYEGHKVEAEIFPYAGCEIIRYESWMTSDGNHPGVVFYSRDKERLQKFSDLMGEEGACMYKIHPAHYTESVVCNIDTEWSGTENINPFYFWYYRPEEYDEEMWDEKWDAHEATAFKAQHGVGAHFVYDYSGDGLIVEPGWFGAENANEPGNIIVTDDEDILKKVVSYYNHYGDDFFVVPTSTEENWKVAVDIINEEERQKEEQERQETIYAEEELLEWIADKMAGVKRRY